MEHEGFCSLSQRQEDIPSTNKQAVSIDEAWEKTVEKGLNALKNVNTWEEANLPIGNRKAIGTKRGNKKGKISCERVLRNFFSFRNGKPFDN